jgi:uncharacterized repeat protein (TIGR01451 family)
VFSSNVLRWIIVMKRLWARLSAVAGVVVALGGGGYYYFTNSGTEANELRETKKPTAQAEKFTAKQTAVPLPDDNGGASLVYGPADAATPLGDLGPTGAPMQPATANWQNTASQPIRRVSAGGQDGTYVAPKYQVGDAGASVPVAAYGEPPYDPSRPFADSTSALPTSPRDYDDPNASYPLGSSTLDAATSAYPATGGVIDPIPNKYGTSEKLDYGPPAPVVGPSYSPPDPSQPVAAPNFANGDAVGLGNPAPGIIGPPPVVNAPVVSSSSPPYDPLAAPTFNPPMGSAIAPRETLPTGSYPAGTNDVMLPGYSPSQAMAPSNANLVAATPGDRSLDGRQTPSISIEKIAPTGTQVGKPAIFKTLIRNTGDVAARNVVVTDQPPRGTRLIDATPQPVQTPDGSLVWQFDSLAPGEEVLISMEVMPQVEGELGSVARITFEAQASVRTICTKPQLMVEHSTDPQVLIGETVVFAITISNPGSGDATGIILEEDVPPGLSHAAGPELEYEVGTLRPGESRRLKLKLKASKAGVTINRLRVRGDANLLAEHATQLEVIAPKLEVGLTGPRRRFLDREVKYQVAFRNSGTATAKNVELATYLPKGLKFVSTSGKGQYDSRDHAVYWSLDQLSPGQVGEVDLIALPIATGEQKLQIEATADLGLLDTHEHVTDVEAITNLVFTVSDTQDPIEVGSETTYEVRIINEGSKTATNVQIDAFLPVELTPISGEGTTRVVVQGQQVLMEPLARMGPGEEAIYKIKVRGRQAGDHLVDVRLVCEEVPTPVTKQESTKVYADGL